MNIPPIPNGNSLNTLAGELPNVPNANPMAAIQSMNANILQLIAVLRLDPIRVANGRASSDTPIRYPPPFVAGGALPSTPAEARNLSGTACTAALDALAGAPGLPPLPANPTAAMCKAHLLGYLGIFP
ncbi:hypothetical protein BDZ89DRAFT_1068020, partial [Hymenopellis radicata]